MLSVQAAVRGLVARRHFKRIRASLLLHAMARGFLARRRCGRALRQRAELRAREIDRKAEEFRYVDARHVHPFESFVKVYGLEARLNST